MARRVGRERVRSEEEGRVVERMRAGRVGWRGVWAREGAVRRRKVG